MTEQPLKVILNRDALLLLEDPPWIRGYTEARDAVGRPYWKYRGQWTDSENEGAIIKALVAMVTP